MADLINPDALHHALDQLPGWGGTTDRLEKTYRFDDAQQAEAFLARVGAQADALDHHPVVDHRGDEVHLALWTHSAGGVTQLDVDLAAKIDGVFNA